MQISYWLKTKTAKGMKEGNKDHKFKRAHVFEIGFIEMQRWVAPKIERRVGAKSQMKPGRHGICGTGKGPTPP